MKTILITILKAILTVLYQPIKLFPVKHRIVYLSRQSNEKSLDMQLLEKEIAALDPTVEQVFRLRMLDGGLGEKIKYCFSILGDLYYLSTSRAAILDTYSIPVSCLKHKRTLKVVQMWHALGAIKKFGLQALGTKDGRDPAVSKALNMHKNYDYVIAPSQKTALFYAEAFGCEKSKIKLALLPHVDYLLDSKNSRSEEFFKLNPDCTAKKTLLYLPTFREREEYVANELKVALEDDDRYRLIIKTHPLSRVRAEERFSYKGDFSTYDLMKIADCVITDYSACAFDTAVLMKPLYFFVPDYQVYTRDRGLNVDLKAEMKKAVFEDAEMLHQAMRTQPYDLDALYRFKNTYLRNTKGSCTAVLAKFIVSLLA